MHSESLNDFESWFSRVLVQRIRSVVIGFFFVVVLVCHYLSVRSFIYGAKYYCGMDPETLDDLDFSDIDVDVKDFAEVKRGFSDVVARLNDYAKKKKLAKGGYPYPNDQMADKKKLDEMTEKCKKFEAIEIENGQLKEQLKSFTEKEKAGKINSLVNAQAEKGLISNDDKVSIADSYKSFSSDQIDALITNTSKMAAAGVQKSFKAHEQGTQDDASKSAKIEELKTKISDYTEAGIGGFALNEAQSELKALEG